MKSKYEYIMPARGQLGKHTGEWIAVVGGEIVASGKDAKKSIGHSKRNIRTVPRSS